MSTDKITYISDTVHQSIAISDLEKGIISTEIFNRLHNVLQTSTAYLTFPASRHSRFIHSVGCMHLAGRIFHSCVLNSEDEVLASFLETVVTEIKEIEAEDSFNVEARGELRGYDGGMPRFEDQDTVPFSDKFYQINLPGQICDREEVSAFLVALQSLRFAALLHDVGHLPFSHVCEQALSRIYEELSAADDLNPRQKKFVERINDLAGEDGGSKYHEPIGRQLAVTLLNKLVGRVNHPSDGDKKKVYNLLLVKEYCLRILSDSDSTSLHDIIDGPVDADRLDFVARDRLMTGLGSAGLNLRRLLQAYRLIRDETSNGDDSFRFLPAARTISTVEEVLKRRFDMYKYVVSHHRVKKTDGLLKRAISEIAEEYLHEEDSTSTSEDDENLRLLTPSISSLWEAFAIASEQLESDFSEQLAQWDDSWLLTVLRQRAYSEPDNEALKRKLQELLANRKSYISLYKRLDSFWEVDDACLAAVPEDFNWESVNPGNGDTESDSEEAIDEAIQDRVQRLGKFYDRVASSGIESMDNGRKRGELFIKQLQSFLVASAQTTDDRFRVVEKAAGRLQEEQGITDVIVEPVSISPGIDPNSYIAVRDGHVRISSVSHVADRLKRDAGLIPPFYTYIYYGSGSEGPSDDTDSSDLREKFGGYLWESFNELYVTA